jgi:cyclopropane-fatty-acyl-phospholipid synthase
MTNPEPEFMPFAFLTEKRLLENLRVALAHVAETLDIPLAVRLWDGSIKPLGKSAQPVPLVSLRSSGVVASLIKHPALENLVKHYAVGDIALEDGDLIASVQQVRSKLKKKDIKRLSKKHLLRLLWPFILVRSQRANPAHDFRQDASGTTHKNKNNANYIQFHYDVGNDFYQLFLDPEMQYSCAYFKQETGSLEQAQQDKLEMICRKLRLKAGEHFLDIGCGWGGLICYAAKHCGVKAHGITLSNEQYEYTRAKIKRLGLEGQVTVEIRDYQALDGIYDKIASIGMFEHIGLANFPAYFKKIHGLLRDKGIVLNHGIARRAKVDAKSALTKITPEKRMILKYIFPGAELAPIGHSVNSMEAHGFEIHDIEAWREHYALTCRHWCQRLSANKDRAIALVGSERYNLWVAYLAGVSFGFLSGSILIFQTVASKRAKEKGPSGLPLTREDLYRAG